jgi:hypothetical protein
MGHEELGCRIRRRQVIVRRLVRASTASVMRPWLVEAVGEAKGGRRFQSERNAIHCR